MSSTTTPSPPPATVRPPGPLHCRRLRDVWRSAGWPRQDMVEIELIAAGLLERRCSAHGHDTLRVTDAGIAVLAGTLHTNRRARDRHEALVERVAEEMTRAGRLAWRGLSLRAQVDGAWVMAMPDVYSIRHTTVEAYLQPVVHEIKVRRADLLADLRRPAKRAAYLQLGGECWYVIAEGIAAADEIPPECGVLVATPQADGDRIALDVARPAPRRPMVPSFAMWMALARATPMAGWQWDESQAPLCAVDRADGLDEPVAQGPAGPPANDASDVAAAITPPPRHTSPSYTTAD